MIVTQGTLNPSSPLHPEREGTICHGRVCTSNSLLRTWKSMSITDSYHSRVECLKSLSRRGQQKSRDQTPVSGNRPSHTRCAGPGLCLIDTLPTGCISCCAVCRSWFALCRATKTGMIEDNYWFRKSGILSMCISPLLSFPQRLAKSWAKNDQCMNSYPWYFGSYF